jgi:hypothetical protein
MKTMGSARGFARVVALGLVSVCLVLNVAAETVVTSDDAPAAVPLKPGQTVANTGKGYASLLGGAELLESKILPGGKSEAFSRVRLYKTAFKYPYILVQEQVAIDGRSGIEVVENRKAMVANHLVVKLKPGKNEQELKRISDRVGASVQRKLKAPDTYLIELSASTIDAVTKAMDELTKEVDVVSAADPDFLI